MSAPPPLLELRGVGAGYGAISALADVSLTVAEGEIVLVGGHTTLTHDARGRREPEGEEETP